MVGERVEHNIQPVIEIQIVATGAWFHKPDASRVDLLAFEYFHRPPPVAPRVTQNNQP